MCGKGLNMIRNLIIAGVIEFITVIITLVLRQLFPALPLWSLIIIQAIIFLILMYAFAVYFWRIAHRIGLIDMPIVAGRWEGKLITSFDGNSKINDVSIIIEQHWLITTVHFQGQDAISHSLVATFFKRLSGEQVLAYIYRTQPTDDATIALEPHIGLCVLRLVEPNRLSGYYHYFFYDSERTEFIRGQLVLTRPRYVAELTIKP